MDVHEFDTYISKHFKFLTRFLEIISREDENKYWKEIFEYADKTDTPLIQGLQVISNDDIVDSNCQYRPRELYAQTWKKINYDKDLIELLFTQVKDMVVTNGFCPQGRTNRCIQIIMLLEK